MSDEQVNSKTRLHKLPFVIKKDALKLGPNTKYGMFRCFPGASGSLIKEDIVYNVKDGDFFKGKYPDLLIINRLNLMKNSSRTIASYTSRDGSVVQLTSDAVAKLIGQDSYDQVFSSLCCVINLELKVKGIFSLLCLGALEQKEFSTIDTQTYESSFTHLIKEKLRQKTKHQRRNKFRSYVVQKPKLETFSKRIIIHPDDLKKNKDIKVEVDESNLETVPISDQSCKDIKLEFNDKETTCNITDKCIKQETDHDSFPELKEIVNEDSNISDVGSVGNLSIDSNFSLIDIERSVKPILNYIDGHTEINKYDYYQGEMSPIVMADGSTVMVRGNPDLFHIATPDILENLSPSDQKKLLLHQAYLDWKFCLQRDEDDNLPIHLAVLNNDVALLKRQCSMLKTRHETVDILAGNLTPLQMAILQNCPGCTEVLLAMGADVMIRDDESRTALHLAAEICAKHVDAILTHCRNNARQILKENDDLWKPELENKPDNRLASYLLTQLVAMCDNQGYTPLMLASKAGNAAAVVLMASAAPSVVNMAMPTCGNTALYLATGAAFTEAANRGDKTKVPENFKRTIEILIRHGADPTIENNSGSNVNVLLAECHDSMISLIIGTSMLAYNGYAPKKKCITRCDAFMLIKDKQGGISVKEVKKTNIRKSTRNKAEGTSMLNYTNDKACTEVVNTGEHVNKNTSSCDTDKPVILNNLPVITKLVSFGKEKPVLVKSISPKTCAENKGLKTEITAKSNSIKMTVPPLVPIGSKGNVPKFLKILPKPETETSKSETTVPKKKPIILRHVATKRPKSNDDDSTASSSKIPKV
ncbi:uncharacterized protein LOC123870738 [Maniola jurtina]|uniref:uncharacterized protein LOC123870738 n=1 Tax=Maniola jurtina TaxID=191418 RepID=UPI001E686BDF|nr:uncharacterized protein LOC123870738 [Maniola jurtina]